MDIHQEKAFILRVSLICGKTEIWRQVAVPARTTFSRFHKVIQGCFCWLGYHLHEFRMLDSSGNVIAKSVMDLSDPDEWIVDPEVPRFSERKRLSSWLPHCSTFTYLYDYGDYWEHSVKLEQVVEKYEGILPVCLDGEGTAPPEDVGGEGGYLDFMRIVNKKRDSLEKRELLVWARSLEWQPFDLQEINQRLRQIRSQLSEAKGPLGDSRIH